MGFSVSGSAAIIFAGLFIAFGMWHTATTNGFERVSEAQQDRTDKFLAEQNTAIALDSAVLDDDQHSMRIRATNRGSTALAFNRTDVLVDNDYRTDWRAEATADGVNQTYLWMPGERLEFNVSASSASQVKLVTETGVADTMEVTTT